MMQLGFVSAILPEASLEEVFATGREYGYDCVELMSWPLGKSDRRYAGITHVEAVGFDEAGARQVTGLSEKYGVAVSGLGYYPNALSADREEAKAAAVHIRRVIQAAAMLGVRSMNTFVGRDWTQSVDNNWSRFVDTWGPLIECAETHDVRIGIENCPMLFTADEWPGGKNLAFSPAIWRRMFEAFPSNAWGLNYDPSHMVWQQMDEVAPLREFRDRIYHVHAKDVRLDRHRLDAVGILANPLEYHTPKLPGLGDMDWGRFISGLLDIEYDGPVCVEVEDRAYEKSLQTRRLALKQSSDYMRSFIPRPSD